MLILFNLLKSTDEFLFLSLGPLQTVLPYRHTGEVLRDDRSSTLPGHELRPVQQQQQQYATNKDENVVGGI